MLVASPTCQNIAGEELTSHGQAFRHHTVQIQLQLLRQLLRLRPRPQLCLRLLLPRCCYSCYCCCCWCYCCRYRCCYPYGYCYPTAPTTATLLLPTSSTTSCSSTASTTTTTTTATGPPPPMLTSHGSFAAPKLKPFGLFKTRAKASQSRQHLRLRPTDTSGLLQSCGQRRRCGLSWHYFFCSHWFLCVLKES